MFEALLDHLTLKLLYWGLALAAAVAVVIWALCDSEWVETWMPNLASEMMGALVTVAVVDFIIRRQRRPLLKNAARRIDASLYSLFQVVMNQRTRMQQSVEETPDAKKMLGQWEIELQGQLPERDWLRYWAANLASVEGSLRIVQDRYGRVLSERLLAALDDFELWSTRAAGDVRWMVSLDNAVASKYPTPTWTPFYVEHFEAARAKLKIILDAYEAEFGRSFRLEDDMWEAARAHRNSQRAGLPIPWPEEE